MRGTTTWEGLLDMRVQHSIGYDERGAMVQAPCAGAGVPSIARTGPGPVRAAVAARVLAVLRHVRRCQAAFGFLCQHRIAGVKCPCKTLRQVGRPARQNDHLFCSVLFAGALVFRGFAPAAYCVLKRGAVRMHVYPSLSRSSLCAPATSRAQFEFSYGGGGREALEAAVRGFYSYAHAGGMEDHA